MLVFVSAAPGTRRLAHRVALGDTRIRTDRHRRRIAVERQWHISSRIERDWRLRGRRRTSRIGQTTGELIDTVPALIAADSDNGRAFAVKPTGPRLLAMTR